MKLRLYIVASRDSLSSISPNEIKSTYGVKSYMISGIIFRQTTSFIEDSTEAGILLGVL